jgi:hypothetical protein
LLVIKNEISDDPEIEMSGTEEKEAVEKDAKDLENVQGN